MQAVPVSRYLAFFSIAIAGLAIDLATKRWIFDWLGLPGGATYWLWEGVAGLQTSLNQGALFGIGQGWVWLFAVLSVAAALGILYWLFLAGAARDWLLTVALGMVMSGILGNLHDRLGLHGLIAPDGQPIYAVRDWILVLIFGHHWPNFNVADALLVCGAILLLGQAWISGKPESTGVSQAEANPNRPNPRTGLSEMSSKSGEF